MLIRTILNKEESWLKLNFTVKKEEEVSLGKYILIKEDSVVFQKFWHIWKLLFLILNNDEWKKQIFILNPNASERTSYQRVESLNNYKKSPCFISTRSPSDTFLFTIYASAFLFLEGQLDLSTKRYFLFTVSSAASESAKS